MNTIITTNQRLVTVLLVLLIILASLLVIGIVRAPLLMGDRMMGMNGQTMSGMMSVCSEMMQNLQAH